MANTTRLLTHRQSTRWPKYGMPKNLPKPTTFAEGQRQLFGLLMAASGVFFGFVGLGLTIFFCFLAYRFPDHRETILWIMAGSLGASWIGQITVTIAMAVGGPVGRFKVTASKDGATLEADGDEETPPTVTVTTAQEVTLTDV